MNIGPDHTHAHAHIHIHFSLPNKNTKKQESFINISLKPGGFDDGGRS